MPLVYLQHESARTRRNILIGKYEMLFDVLMWSVEVKEAVHRHLKDEEHRAGKNDISILHGNTQLAFSHD